MQSASDAESWRWLQLVDLKQPQEKTKKRLKHGCCSSVRFYHFYQNLLVLLRIFVSNTLCATWKSTSITKSQIIKAVKLLRNHGPSVALKLQKKKSLVNPLKFAAFWLSVYLFVCGNECIRSLCSLSTAKRILCAITPYVLGPIGSC